MSKHWKNIAVNGSFLIAITIINSLGGEMPIELVHGKTRRISRRIIHTTAEYELKTGEDIYG